MPVSDQHTFFFERHTLDLRRGCLSRDGREIGLRPKSFAVLRYLVENAGRLIAKDELITAVWAHVSVTDASLARCVSDVRLALADQEQQIVKTVSRRGYLFAAPVTPVAAETAAAGTSDAARPRRQQSERRQLTVMACDLAGLSRALAGGEFENLRNAATAFRRRCTEIIEQHHGVVAGFTDDSLSAYFGYPEAREEDAENSTRAALALQQFAASSGAEIGLQPRPRIGIASGLVVIGDECVAGGEVEHAVVGDIPVLAARLRALAEPGQIVIEQRTQRLVGGLFEYDELGPFTFKGITAGDVSRVICESGVESRFEAHHSALLTPLVGREEELELLHRRWQQAKAGEGSVILLAGEPGIGKSRVAEAAFASLAREDHIAQRLFCSPHRQNSALSPIILQLARAAGFRRTDSDEERLTKLQRMLAPADQASCAAVPLLADLLSVSTGDRYPRLERTPQQQKDATLKALLSCIERQSASRPLVMAVEDLHWADPTSIELIDLIVERASHLRVLLIVTYRPEFSPPWIGRSHTSLITLGRLPQRHCEAMVAAVAGGEALPKTIVDEIVERTDGVPLFIEELTKAVVEGGAVSDAGDHYTAAGKLPALDIPLTLHASLLARLDRLGVARKVAQIGAALGRRFSYELIAAVSAMPQRALDDALARLESAGLVWRRGNPPDAEYMFKHALVQDAAYGTLLREARRSLHARIAEMLESRFSDIGIGRPELLAHHYTEAGRIEKAAALWGEAGQFSLAHSAVQEAAVQLARALEQIETLSSTTARRRDQIRLQLALANALMHTKGYAARETNVALDRVRVLAERAQGLGEPLEDPLLLFSVLHGFWVANHVAFNGDAIATLAEQFLGLAKQQKATFPLVLGHRLMGTSLLYLGDIEGGRAHLDDALANYDPVEHRPLASRLGQDGGVAILSNRLLALWLLGYPDAAAKDADDALENAREIDQAGTYLYALTRIASFHLTCGNYEAAAAQSQELMTIAEQIDGTYWKAAGTMIQGCLFALTGKASIAIPMITAGMTASRTTGARLRAPWYWSCLARAHVGLGDLTEAWRCIDEAMAVMEMTKETWQESDFHRIAGDLTLLSPAPDFTKAEAHFQRALAVAGAQKAKIWELRAATRLAQLWREQGAVRRAHNLLRPIYDWFTEGLTTTDLCEAGLLLAELESSAAPAVDRLPR